LQGCGSRRRQGAAASRAAVLLLSLRALLGAA